ncbi:MAG: tetratricopeptide repeat protein [Cyclobacteriaceae bacterium]|nr:tetratricopeptide repeat protein [Cyclobacteriaceae bacterium SS2]
MPARLLSILFILFLIGCGPGESRKADQLFNQGKFKEAIAAYSHYISENPRSVGAIYNRGRAYEELGNYDQAEQDFTKVSELDEKNVNAYLSLAKLYYRQELYTKALIYTESALEINENSADGYFLNARAQHQLGYIDGAMESYTLAIKINKDYGEAYLYRGALKIHKNQTRSACEDFKKAENLEVADASAILKKYCK